MNLSFLDWLAVCASVGGGLCTFLGAAWKLLIQPKHAQIGRLWEEVRKREKELSDARIEFIQQFVTKAEMNAIMARLDEVMKRLEDKLDRLIERREG